MEHIARTTKQIGALLRRQRKQQGLTQTQLGERTNLRQATISALENGEASAKLRTIVDVMAALRLELVIRERTRAGEDIEDLF